MRKFIALCLILCSTATTVAVQTSYWTHTSADDFNSGTLDRVVATSHGELRLTRKVDFLLGDDPRVSAVYSLAETPDGTLYAGTGPQGVLLAFKGGKLETAANLGNHSSIFCLAVDGQGRLLIGTAGERGRVLRLDGPGHAPKELLSSPAVQYVWGLATTPDGIIYAATGPNGQVHQIAPDGKVSVLFDSGENNVLSIISDGKDLLYCGTDPNGLIYRVNRKTGEAFVLYDCAESEVSALALDDRGNLYAGTSQAGSDATEPPPAAGAGRPETGPKPDPLPSDEPRAPAPPERPEPNPNDPQMPRSNTRPGQSQAIGTAGYVLVSQPEIPDDAPLGPATEPALPQPQDPDVPHRALGEAPEGGNAIYRITPDGFVSEIFRAPVTIFAILPDNGSLLVATGGEGQVFNIDVNSEESSVIADTESSEALSLLRGRDGRIYLGLANAGNLATISKGYAQTGTFVSPVLDATQVSRFGKLQLRGSMPAGTKLTVATRSGNVNDPDHPGWSRWTDEIAASEFVQIAAPSARFLQYRLTFNSSNDGTASASVSEVTVAYQVPNVAPRISSLSISSTGASRTPPATDTLTAGAAPHQTQTITWDASDSNSDSLVFGVYFRAAGSSEWILLKDGVTETTYEWNTRAVGDGRYEIRVIASDEFANPPGQGKTASRVSEAIIVDNTPPVIGDIKAVPEPGKARISCRIVDRTTTVARLEYAVNSAQVWQTVLPVDTISDSPEETYDFVLPVKSPGAAQITLRATDERGNVSYETLRVSIPEAK